MQGQLKPINLQDPFAEEYKRVKEELNQRRQNEQLFEKPSIFSKDYFQYLKTEKQLLQKINQDSYDSEDSEVEKTITQFKNDNLNSEEKRLTEIKKRLVEQKSTSFKKYEPISPKSLKSPYDYFWYFSKLKKYYVLSWENLAYGITFKELEKILLILCFIRFCVYSFKYDIKTSLIICTIGLISAFFYEMILTDCIAICYERLYLNSSIFRFAFEEYLERLNYELYTAPVERLKPNDSIIIYPNWILNIINNSPVVISSKLQAFQQYLDYTLIPFCSKIIRDYAQSVKALLLYTMVLRLGKKYVPYHIQWHLMLYVLYAQFGKDYWQMFENSNEFLNDVLIPEFRFEEVEFLELLQSMLLGITVYGIMLAMLHALFSQYFYIPFLVPNIEAHIGKRPKKSIYSGGYTSWQDEQQLFVPSSADWKIWFGFLGKGTKNRKNKKKKKRRGNENSNNK